MPRIDDQILECVIYLYPSEEAAREGERAGGSGFLVGVPLPVHSDRGVYYAVTNSHVIREGGSPVVRLNTKDGLIDVIPAKPENWLHHPDADDIAICPIGLSAERYRFKIILPSLFITKDIIAEHNIGPGDDTFLVGRFINHEGKQRNLPSVRFGNIAMMPWEPIPHPTRGIDQESFLVESRSIGGYSGSPVFVWVPPLVHRPGKNALEARSYGPWLLGIDWCHITNMQNVRERDGETEVTEGWKVPSNTGMMGVIPAWRLAELLEEDDLVDHRKQIDDRITENNAQGGAQLDALPKFTKREFDNALKRVSRRVKPSESDSESSGT